VTDSPHHRPDDHLVEPMFSALRGRGEEREDEAPAAGAGARSGPRSGPQRTADDRPGAPPAPRATRRGCLGGASAVLLALCGLAAAAGSRPMP